MFLNRRAFLKAAGLSLAGPALYPLPARGGSAGKPNIVLIFLDDSGWADFHLFGRPAYKTPNVERLAKEGCRFTQFYVPQAVCSASRRC